MTLDRLRRLAVSQTLFPLTTLKRALHKLAYVQADPIRAPARAQDLMLRHRVTGYRAGDLERRYTQLGVEEDFFLNYGFVTKALQALMHPRPDLCVPAIGPSPWSKEQRQRVQLLMEFVRERGPVHPREVDAHFAHGKVRNYWGGQSSATTQLLDTMHYSGMLRVVRRESGVRVYATQHHGPEPENEAERHARMDALCDAVIRLHAPLPERSLRFFLRRLRFCAPQWAAEIAGTIGRAKARLEHARVDGVDWYWPPRGTSPRDAEDDAVRLLSPFDPVVHDRDRFELLWGWAYRFEAYTPAPKRKLGYYALPLLWRDRVIGWGNLSMKDGELQSEIGFVKSKPRDRVFRRELEAELERIRLFFIPAAAAVQLKK